MLLLRFVFALTVSVGSVSLPALTGQPAGRVTAPKQNVIVTTTTLVPNETMTKWNRVAWCETHGNWKMQGATFSGGLGISNVVWNEYGGTDFAPNAGLATPQEQVVIAIRINGTFVPDQFGYCRAW